MSDTTQIKKPKKTPGVTTQSKYEIEVKRFKHLYVSNPQKLYDAINSTTYVSRGDPTPKYYAKGTILNILSAFKWHLETNNNDRSNDNVIKEFSKFITDNKADLNKQRDAKRKSTNRTTKGTLRKAVIKDASSQFDDFTSMLNNYLQNNKGRISYKYWVIGNLYILAVTRRVQDYALMKVSQTLKDTSDNKFNYFVLSNNTFVFNQYKTAYVYGQEKIKVPMPLAKILKDFVKSDNLHTGDLMFNNEMYIHRAIKDVFGTTVNKIRKAQNISFYGGKTKDEIIEHARQMGHSVLTGILQYLD